MINWITQNWELILAAATGGGWLWDRQRLRRGDDLNVLRSIIAEQKAYTDTLQRRVTELQSEFEDKCAEMQANMEKLHTELAELKKKLIEK